MQRAATDVMQSIIFAAVVDALAALKAASSGVPNTMLRDIQAIHRNVTFADLPKELQDAIAQQRPLRVHPAAEGRLCGRPQGERCSSRGRWTACRSASGAVPRRSIAAARARGPGRRGPGGGQRRRQAGRRQAARLN